MLDGNPLGSSEPAPVDHNGSASADSPSNAGDIDNKFDNSETYLITSDIAPPKRYAHFGKRRKSFTEEMFRCPHTDKVSRSELICGALLWRNRPEKLREHLLEHLSKQGVHAMSDDQVISWYIDAKHIMLSEIPEDTDFSSDDEVDNLDCEE
jgi:hypothetical protein